MIMTVAKGWLLFALGLFSRFGSGGLIAGSHVVIVVLGAVLVLEVVELGLDMATVVFL